MLELARDSQASASSDSAPLARQIEHQRLVAVVHQCNRQIAYITREFLAPRFRFAWKRHAGSEKLREELKKIAISHGVSGAPPHGLYFFASKFPFMFETAFSRGDVHDDDSRTLEVWLAAVETICARLDQQTKTHFSPLGHELAEALCL